jgi:hypothetical protein
MTSIIKVDTIQTAAGGTPTASSLGIGGTIGQVLATDTTTSKLQHLQVIFYSNTQLQLQ